MILENQLVFKSGINKNKFNVVDDILKKTVEDFDKEYIPLTLNYDEKNVIGSVTNLKYRDGAIYADINIADFFKESLDDKVGRLAFLCDRRVPDDEGNYTLENISIYSCGFCEKINDALIF